MQSNYVEKKHPRPYARRRAGQLVAGLVLTIGQALWGAALVAAHPVTELQLLNEERPIMHCKQGDVQCMPRSYGDTIDVESVQKMDWDFDPTERRACREDDLDGRIFDMLYYNDVPVSAMTNSYSYVSFVPNMIVVYSGFIGHREHSDISTAGVETQVMSLLNIVPHIDHHYELDSEGYMHNLFYNPYTKYRCTVMLHDAGAREAGDLVVFGYRPEKNGITFRKIFVVFRPMQ